MRNPSSPRRHFPTTCTGGSRTARLSLRDKSIPPSLPSYPLPQFPQPCYPPSMNISLSPLVPAKAGTHPSAPHSGEKPALVKTKAGIQSLRCSYPITDLPHPPITKSTENPHSFAQLFLKRVPRLKRIISGTNSRILDFPNESILRRTNPQKRISQTLTP